MRDSDLKADFLTAEEVPKEYPFTARMLRYYRQKKLLRYGQYGKRIVYRRSWLDAFCEEWSGIDMSSPEKVDYAIACREYERKHGLN